ncbi:MAG: hypothetical protein ACR2OE_07600 [Thermomicrobiales bacterium]
MNSPTTERRNIVCFSRETGEIGECLEVTDRRLHPGVERIECVVAVAVVTAQHCVERAVERILWIIVVVVRGIRNLGRVVSR